MLQRSQAVMRRTARKQGGLRDTHAALYNSPRTPPLQAQVSAMPCALRLTGKTDSTGVACLCSCRLHTTGPRR